MFTGPKYAHPIFPFQHTHTNIYRHLPRTTIFLQTFFLLLHRTAIFNIFFNQIRDQLPVNSIANLEKQW